jgi:PAP2 superfamily
MTRVLACLIACVLIFSCNSNSGNYKIFTQNPILFTKTVKRLNDIVLENNFPPMIATRNYAYASIAAYECIAAEDSGFISLSGQIKHLPKMPGLAAKNDIDYQFAAVLAFTKVGNAVTFPEGSMMEYYDEMIRLADSAGMPEKVLQNSKMLADTISRAILDWSRGDNYATTRGASRYNVTDEEGRWVPTPPMYASGMEPHWMEIRPIIMDSAAQFKPNRPPVYDIKNKDGIFYKEMMKVKNIGDSLTDEQKHIADFWDDNPFKMNVTGHVMFATKKFSPSGHWMNIVGIASSKANADFNTTVAAYAKTAIAIFDGFISCWDEKYRSNYIRPETVINAHFDQEWRPYIQTPPFPSYTSGHSTISAAAAEVMSDYFGDNMTFTDTSLLEFGINNRVIKTFREAAVEAGISRLYGGIHYQFDLDAGNEAGRKIGALVNSRLRMKRQSVTKSTN